VRVLLGYRLNNLLGIKLPLRAEIITDLAVFPLPASVNAQGFDTFMGVGFGVSSRTPLGPLSASVGISSNRDVTFRIAVGIPPRERM